MCRAYVSYPWRVCTSEEDKSLRILVYSGDDDSVCATRGTQMWIDNMKWTATQDWTSWTYDGQVTTG